MDVAYFVQVYEYSEIAELLINVMIVSKLQWERFSPIKTKTAREKRTAVIIEIYKFRTVGRVPQWISELN